MLISHKIDENTIIFQTSCWYTDDGQVIVARRIGEFIFFLDYSRGIGICEIEGTCGFNAQAIHQAYLHGRSGLSASGHCHTDEQAGWNVLKQLAKDNMHHVPPAGKPYAIR